MNVLGNVALALFWIAFFVSFCGLLIPGGILAALSLICLFINGDFA